MALELLAAVAKGHQASWGQPVLEWTLCDVQSGTASEVAYVSACFSR